MSRRPGSPSFSSARPFAQPVSRFNFQMMPQDKSSAAQVREGEIIAGKYRIERVLGVGGMGVVVAAHHLQLDEKVALKFLLPQALGDMDAVARFAREARAAVKIKSEHVARVTDVGTLPNGSPYMVMEYLDGEDLHARLKERGPLPIEQAVEFVLQACVAVADAHALGIVHRDLKPANLFCVRRSDGQLSIKVLDFGISKVIDTTGLAPGAMTRTSALMGSPLYMSPEQMRSSKEVDSLTDIWALGVILFELMVGRAPFLAESVTELAIKVAGEPAPAVHTLRADVPSGLDVIVLKCLEKDRRKRFRNVAELAVALLPFAPPRARGSVERISGIIDAAGLSPLAATVAMAQPASPTEPQAPAPLASQPSHVLPLSAGTLPPFGRTTVGESRDKKPFLVGAGVLGVVALLGVVGSASFWSRARMHRVDLQVAASQLPSAEVTLPPAIDAIPSGDLSKPSASSVVPASSAPHGAAVAAIHPADAASARRTPLAVQQAVSPGAATSGPRIAQAPPKASSAPAANCDPPYYFDAKGTKLFKRDCL